MRIDAISIGKNPPKEVNVIVEVPVGGEPIKYEMDKEAGTLVVDRFLYTSMRYPGNYGFIPHTLSDDGDPVRRADRQPARHHSGRRRGLPPGRRAQDAGRGGGDEKIIAVPDAKLTRRYENVHDYTDLPEITLSRSSTSSSTTRTSNPASG
jgi:inorganic pyrophosphatase